MRDQTALKRVTKVLTSGKGKQFFPLNDHLVSGNLKIPRTTAIFNMGSATDCPSNKLGLCTAYALGSRGKRLHICYALKAERGHFKYPLQSRRRQETFWKTVSAEDFVSQFILLNSIKELPYDKLRLNESGDFWDQECVTKANLIAMLLKRWGIRTYCYTHRRDLDFSGCNHLVVSGSGFKVHNHFQMIRKSEFKPKGYMMCPMDCRKCDKCSTKGHKIAVVRH